MGRKSGTAVNRNHTSAILLQTRLSASNLNFLGSETASLTAVFFIFTAKQAGSYVDACIRLARDPSYKKILGAAPAKIA